jgi:hypothetical protein
MTKQQNTAIECQVCHRKAKPEELTTGTFLVAGKEETLPAHQRCLDREHARFERFIRQQQRRV